MFLHTYALGSGFTVLYAFPQEVIAFQQDQSPDVRKFVVEFMEDAWYVCVYMYMYVCICTFFINYLGDRYKAADFA